MKQSLNSFFKAYINAFFRYNTELVQGFYQLPCTLNTPEQLLVLTDDNINEELARIFTQLETANLQGMKLFNSSYDMIDEHLAVVNINWQLFTENEELFTEFCAIYHVAYIDNAWKILTINSHELNQHLTFTQTLDLT